MNTGRISGGTGLNRVPDRAVAEGEFRAFRPEVYAAARDRLLALAGPGVVRSMATGMMQARFCRTMTGRAKPITRAAPNAKTQSPANEHIPQPTCPP